MRIAWVMFLVVLVPAGFARADSPDATKAAAARDEAGWADWDARARIAEGDYEGAVQAKRRADAARQAERALAAAAPRRP